MPNEKFPYGPRQFKEGDPPLPAPRSMPDDAVIEESPTENTNEYYFTTNSEETGRSFSDSSKAFVNKSKRRKRSFVVADRKVRSADVGVSGLYEVISEADLAFSPDSRAEAVTVFQGRIREEVVYGICMPVPGFSILFVLVAVSAVVSALVAGSLLYRYQLQKEQMAERAQQNGTIPMSTFANWMGFRLLKRNGVSPVSEVNGSVDGSVVRHAIISNKTEEEHSPD